MPKQTTTPDNNPKLLNENNPFDTELDKFNQQSFLDAINLRALLLENGYESLSAWQSPVLYKHADQILNGMNLDSLLENVDSAFLLGYWFDDLARVTRLMAAESESNRVALFIEVIDCLDIIHKHKNGALLFMQCNIVFDTMLTTLDLSEKTTINEVVAVWMFSLLGLLSSIKINKFDELDLQFETVVINSLNSSYKYLALVDNLDIQNDKQQNLLHWLAATKCRTKDHDAIVAKLIQYLLDHGLDCRQLDEAGKSALDYALQNPTKDALREITTHYSLDNLALEQILYQETQAKNKTNILWLLASLAARPFWNNYALCINGISMWEHQTFIDLEMVDAVRIILQFSGKSLTLDNFLNVILAKNTHALFQIGSCVLLREDMSGKNVLLYLAGKPALCAQMSQRTSSEYLLAFYRLKHKGKLFGLSYVHLCFNSNDKPILLALEQRNIHFFILTLRITENHLQAKHKKNLTDSILYLVKQGVDVMPLEDYLREGVSIFPGFKKELLNKITQAKEERKRNQEFFATVSRLTL